MQPQPFPFHQSIANVLQFFDWRHLPEHLAKISKPFAELAFDLANRLDPSPELTVALRKLLEAKDAAVRASKGGDALVISVELNEALRSE